MKSTLSLLMLLVSLVMASTFSCKKREESLSTIHKSPIDFYSEKFQNDKALNGLFDKVMKSNIKINLLQLDKRRGGEADTSLAYDFLAEIVTAQVMLMAEQPAFFELPTTTQTQVFNNVAQSIATAPSQVQASNTSLYTQTTQSYNLLMQSDLAKISAPHITWGEFAGCTMLALGTAIGEYGGIVGEIRNLFIHGPKYLTWDGVWSIARKVVRNAVPWYKVFSVAVGYASCLWASTLSNVNNIRELLIYFK